MDELLKALAQAVREGTELAYPALLGFYIVSVLKTLLPCLTVFGCFLSVLKIVKHINNFDGLKDRIAKLESKK